MLKKLYQKMELKTIEITQDDFLSVYPSEYIEWITKQLNCKKSDLCLLAVHPDFEESDEEGWNIESFFPAKTEIKQEIVHSDDRKKMLYFENFAIGDVLKIQVNNKVFIADYNASPCSVWANKANL